MFVPFGWIDISIHVCKKLGSNSASYNVQEVKILLIRNLFHISTIYLSRFTQEDISSNNILKSSVQRAMKKTITETYPLITEEIIEEIFPKKLNIISTKWYFGPLYHKIFLLII